MFPHGFKLQFTDKELDVYKIDYFGERRNQIKCTCDFLTQHDKHSKMLKLYQKLQRFTNNFILSKKKLSYVIISPLLSLTLSVFYDVRIMFSQTRLNILIFLPIFG